MRRPSDRLPRESGHRHGNGHGRLSLQNCLARLPKGLPWGATEFARARPLARPLSGQQTADRDVANGSTPAESLAAKKRSFGSLTSAHLVQTGRSTPAIGCFAASEAAE